MTLLQQARDTRRRNTERRILAQLNSDGWEYGLDLMLRARLRPGRFYPALRRLEEAGAVESAWEDQQPGRPRRRVYRLGQWLRMLRTPPPEFVCPRCGAESWHPMDRRYGYCGRCLDYTGEGT